MSEDGRRTLCVELTFDGSEFEGWQRQEGRRTVQGEVEAGLESILGEAHSVVGCGRTDAGVHARQMFASFRTVHDMAVDDVVRALDAVVPEDIGVLSVREMAPEFHARRDAIWKWYRYDLLVSSRKQPLLGRTATRLPAAPPLDRLEDAAAPLRGRHDFRSFANTGSSPGSTTERTMHSLVWSQEEDLLHLDVVGDGFLYKMVRTVVGTLLEAARSDDPAGAVSDVLAARNRSAAGAVAPARGLCLMAVALRGETPPPQVPDFLRPSVDLGTSSVTGGET